jgi:DNA invertase Pin-like site-specific DNA recombinase
VDHLDALGFLKIDVLALGELSLDLGRACRAGGVAVEASRSCCQSEESTRAGKAFLDMLRVFAEFETNLRRERQMEGIAKAKANGVYKGRKAVIDVTGIKALK